MDASPLATETSNESSMMRNILCVLVIFVMVGCRGVDEVSLDVPNDAIIKEAVPDQELWDSRIVLTHAGKVNARLYAEHIAKYEKLKRVHLDTVTVDFYNTDGSHASVLTARKGKIDEQTSDLEALGNVVVRADKGVALATEKLYWCNKTGKITTNAPVKITTAQDTITGDGLESDPRLENWRIMRNIRGTFRRATPLATER